MPYRELDDDALRLCRTARQHDMGGETSICRGVLGRDLNLIITPDRAVLDHGDRVEETINQECHVEGDRTETEYVCNGDFGGSWRVELDNISDVGIHEMDWQEEIRLEERR